MAKIMEKYIHMWNFHITIFAKKYERKIVSQARFLGTNLDFVLSLKSIAVWYGLCNRSLNGTSIQSREDLSFNVPTP